MSRTGGQKGGRHAGPLLLLIVQVSVAVFGQEPPVDPFTPARVERKPSPTSNGQGRLDSNQSQIPETRVRGTGARGRLRLLLVDGKNDQTYILPDSRSIELPLKPGQDEPDHLISMRLSRASLSDFFRLLARLSNLNILTWTLLSPSTCAKHGTCLTEAIRGNYTSDLKQS